MPTLFGAMRFTRSTVPPSKPATWNAARTMREKNCAPSKPFRKRQLKYCSQPTHPTLSAALRADMIPLAGSAFRAIHTHAAIVANRSAKPPTPNYAPVKIPTPTPPRPRFASRGLNPALSNAPLARAPRVNSNQLSKTNFLTRTPKAVWFYNPKCPEVKSHEEKARHQIHREEKLKPWQALLKC